MTRKLTPDQLDEIEAVAKKATPGEWRVNGERIEAGDLGEVIFPGPVECSSYCYGGSSTIDGDDLDADFAHIATMDPAATLALVAEVRGLRAKVERVRELHRENAYPDRPVSRCRDCDDVWPCETARALGEGA